MAYEYIKDNLERIKEQCLTRAEQLGITPPKLVAVTKSATAEEVLALVGFGQKAIAENRTSLFCERYDLFADGERPEMHLIGSLQTNKVKYIMGKCALIHSLDSERLASEINKRAEKCGIRMGVLMEINSGREEAKGGIMPEDALRFAEMVKGYSHLALRGVMTMAPICDSKEAYRPYFRETASIFRRLGEEGFLEGEGVLSMGMSNSYETALEEGSTLIRVGRGLFVKP